MGKIKGEFGSNERGGCVKRRGGLVKRERRLGETKGDVHIDSVAVTKRDTIQEKRQSGEARSQKAGQDARPEARKQA